MLSCPWCTNSSYYSNTMLREDELLTVFSQLTKPEIVNALQGTGVRSNETRTRGTLFEAVYDDETRHERLVSAVGEKRHRIEDEHWSALKRA